MFRLTFVTPEKKIAVEQELEKICLPGFRGQLNILDGHAPLTTALSPGLVIFTLKTGQEQKYAINWGYCQISAEGVSIMAETAVAKEDVDKKASTDRIDQIEKRLSTETLGDIEFDKSIRDRQTAYAELELL